MELAHTEIDEILSYKISEKNIRKFPWSLDGTQDPIKYGEVINYLRGKDENIPNCVMCDLTGVLIPKQNKDVCKTCDSCFWYNESFNLVFKFCKGCKNFFALSEFHDRPEASKCGKCRKRGRDNYHISKKNAEISYCSFTTPDSHSTDILPTSSSAVNMPQGVSTDAIKRVQFSLADTESTPLQRMESLEKPPKIPRKIDHFDAAGTEIGITCVTPVMGTAIRKRPPTLNDDSNNTSSDSSPLNREELSYKKRRMQSYVSHQSLVEAQSVTPLHMANNVVNHMASYSMSSPVLRTVSLTPRSNALCTPQGSATINIAGSVNVGNCDFTQCTNSPLIAAKTSSTFTAVVSPPMQGEQDKENGDRVNTRPFSAARPSAQSLPKSLLQSIHKLNKTPCFNSASSSAVRMCNDTPIRRTYSDSAVGLTPHNLNALSSSSNSGRGSSEKWHWDPSQNPLMQFATTIACHSPSLTV